MVSHRTGNRRLTCHLSVSPAETAHLSAHHRDHQLISLDIHDSHSWLPLPVTQITVTFPYQWDDMYGGAGLVLPAFARPHPNTAHTLVDNGHSVIV